MRWIPISKQEKLQIIESNILPSALYGIEMTGGCPSVAKVLQSAIADVIGARAQRRSQLGAFEVQKKKKDLDPEVAIMVRRAALLRRRMDKFPHLEEKIKAIVERYEEVDKECEGKEFDVHDEEGVTLKRAGPVGFFMDNLKEVQARLTIGLDIEHDEEQRISLKHAPWQKLQEDVQELAKKKRSGKAAQEREAYAELQEVDSVAIRAAISKRSPDELNIIRHSASVAGWTAAKKQEAGIQEDNRCQLCQQVENNHAHMQWKCIAIHSKRKETYMKKVNPEDLPKHLLMGMPGMMCKEIHTTFWGRTFGETGTKDKLARAKMGLPKDAAQASPPP